MHSRTGYSGAPVWFYRLAGANLISVFNRQPSVPDVINYGMIGIHCGQFPEELGIGEGKTITGYSGMTIALPAWKIQELLLMNERFKQQRKKTEDEARRGPLDESARDESVEVNARFVKTVSTMLNTPPSKPRKKAP